MLLVFAYIRFLYYLYYCFLITSTYFVFLGADDYSSSSSFGAGFSREFKGWEFKRKDSMYKWFFIILVFESRAVAFLDTYSRYIVVANIVIAIEKVAFDVKVV
ncbi:hypothetical protein GE21DRAFT_1275426 [Neurospora crassa]|nr:hypothetical protein GE21DRAFT_1275426 [Neurospora crassa]